MGGDQAGGAGQPHERGADGFRDLLVQFVGDNAADVIRLEDLRVLPHFGFPSGIAWVTIHPWRHATGRRDALTNEPTGLRAAPGGHATSPAGRVDTHAPYEGRPRSSGDERSTR